MAQSATQTKTKRDSQLDSLTAALQKAHITVEKKGSSLSIEGGKLLAYYDTASGQPFTVLTPKGDQIMSSKFLRSVVVRIHSLIRGESPMAEPPVSIEAIPQTKETAVVKPAKNAEVKAVKEPKKKTIEHPKNDQPKRRTKMELRIEKNQKIVDPPIIPSAILKRATEAVQLCDLKDSTNNKTIEGFLGIKNIPNDRVVSVVTDTYNLLPNKQIVDPILNYLETEKVRYKLDSFTHITDKRMRLHLTFPDLVIKDDTKEGILSSIFVHNSYNMLESFRLIGGAMRQICTNGMVVGTELTRVKVVHKATHIEDIAAVNIDALLKGFYKNTELIEQKIKSMINEKATIKLLMQLGRVLDGKVFSHLMRYLGLADEETSNRDIVRSMEQLDTKMKLVQSEWAIYNILTDYISHYIQQSNRVDYLRRMSGVLSL